jgi:hypothetical protein
VSSVQQASNSSEDDNGHDNFSVATLILVRIFHVDSPFMLGLKQEVNV